MSSEKPSLAALRIDRSAIPEKRRNPWILPVVILALLAIGTGVFLRIRSAGTPEVKTAVARQQSLGAGARQTLLNASGYVTARRSATVSSKVTGKVVEILVDEGMEVKSGQLLARLDASNVEASLRLAAAQLESSRATLAETRSSIELAEKEHARYRELIATQATSVADLDRADSQVKSLTARLLKQTADVGVAEAEVAQWRQQVEDTVILAPFGGIVISKNAQPGEMISPMSVGGFTRTGICTIVDMASLEIEVDVNESYINRVERGQPAEATLDSYPDWRIPAKVIAIIPTADRQKATVKVRAGFDQLDPRILPDMAVKVAFHSNAPAGPESAHSVVVPKAAIHDDEGRSIVWVVRDGKIERRAVKVAQTLGDESTIALGLGSGETVVTGSSSKLSDGAKVKIPN